MDTYDILLEEISNHDDHVHVLLDNHSPEVWNSVAFLKVLGPLGSNIASCFYNALKLDIIQ